MGNPPGIETPKLSVPDKATESTVEGTDKEIGKSHAGIMVASRKKASTIFTW